MARQKRNRVPSVVLNVIITKEQHERLIKISEMSLKSQAVLVREALELLFRTPGI